MRVIIRLVLDNNMLQVSREISYQVITDSKIASFLNRDNPQRSNKGHDEHLYCVKNGYEISLSGISKSGR